MKIRYTHLLIGIICLQIVACLPLRGQFDVDFFESIASILIKDNSYQQITSIKNNIDWIRAKNLYDTNARNTVITNESKLKIPKKIHQIWLGSPFPEKYRSIQRSWIINHPKWKYKLWTDKDIAALKLTNQYAYDHAKNYGQKSDIARYEILFREGGLYVDTDFECLRPFDLLHYYFDFYTGSSSGPDFLVFNGLIACAPGNRIIYECIKTLNIGAQHSNDISLDILSTTGPYHFTKCFKKYSQKAKAKCVALPPTYFYPWPNNHRLEKSRSSIESWLRPESMAIHHWEVSWNNGKAPGS